MKYQIMTKKVHLFIKWFLIKQLIFKLFMCDQQLSLISVFTGIIQSRIRIKTLFKTWALENKIQLFTK